MNGWWYHASVAQRLAQIDGAIELGLSSVFVAKNCGARASQVVAKFAIDHGRRFSQTAAAGRAGRRAGVKRSRSAAYFRGEDVDMWRDGLQDRSLSRSSDPEELILE